MMIKYFADANNNAKLPNRDAPGPRSHASEFDENGYRDAAHETGNNPHECLAGPARGRRRQPC